MFEQRDHLRNLVTENPELELKRALNINAREYGHLSYLTGSTNSQYNFAKRAKSKANDDPKVNIYKYQPRNQML